jgi:Mg2+ and Co2+ transporter CorA
VVEDAVEEIPALLKRDEAFLWLDVPQWTRDVDDLLATELNLHAVARAYCKVRNHMPMVHGYRDHVFMVLHRPVVLGAGDTLLVELDMFVGDRFVVTVHKRDEPQPRGIIEEWHGHSPWPEQSVRHAVMTSVRRGNRSMRTFRALTTDRRFRARSGQVERPRG